MGEEISPFSISVIIPAYNAERTIIRTLESVRMQYATEYIMEILVINDGSTDNTEYLVKKYIKMHDKMPVRIINKANGGVSSARNRGLKESKGDWIALLDSDDEWFPDKLQKQIEIISRHSEIDFLGGNHTNKIIKIRGKCIEQLYRPSVKELCIKMLPQTSTVIFKKKIYEEIGGYDESRRYCEDGQFFLKICENYNYYYMPDQIVKYDGGRRGFGETGLSGNLREMHNGEIKNFRELRERNAINLFFYYGIRIYSQAKYVRRIVICKMEK